MSKSTLAWGPENTACREFDDGSYVLWHTGRINLNASYILETGIQEEVREHVKHLDDSRAIYYPAKNKKPEGEHSGGSVSYYKVAISDPTTPGTTSYTAECNDIIEALGMNYAEGNVFKALWRSCAARTLGKKKQGNDEVYDAEKMNFFSQQILRQRKNARSTD